MLCDAIEREAKIIFCKSEKPKKSKIEKSKREKTQKAKTKTSQDILRLRNRIAKAKTPQSFQPP
jgi:hypothetical protein